MQPQGPFFDGSDAEASAMAERLAGVCHVLCTRPGDGKCRGHAGSDDTNKG